MRLPPLLDTEREMDEFVRSIGGVVVLDELGTRSPLFPNADYLFRAESIVAELKCLKEDKSDDRSMQRSIQKLFEKFLDAGRIPNPGPGYHLIQSKDYPPEFQNALYRIVARPIKRRLDKANRQIKQTKRRMGLEGAHGLVFVANDGNYRVEPAQFAHSVRVALGRDFSSIDSLVLFSENLYSRVPGLRKLSLAWMVASRSGHPAPPEDFLNRFFVGWSRHVSEKIGEPIELLGPISYKDLEAMRYVRAPRRGEEIR